jgi:thiol-disulfide isomerase/thioredoxin
MRSLFVLVVLVASGLLVPMGNPLIHADQKPTPAAVEAARQFTAIEEEWQKAEQEFQNALRAAKTDAEFDQIYTQKKPDPKPFAVRFLKVAEVHPDTWGGAAALYWVICHAKGTEHVGLALTQFKKGPIAKAELGRLWSLLFFQMQQKAAPIRELAPLVFARVVKELAHPKAPDLLIWVCDAIANNDSSPEGTKLYRQAGDLLMTRFPDTKYLWVFCELLQCHADPSWAQKHLRTALDKTKTPAVRVAASFALAFLLQNRDADSQAEAEELYRRVIKEAAHAVAEWDKLVYSPDRRESIRHFPDKDSWVQPAQRELEEIKTRGLGKPAPEVAGEDLEGKPIRLSGYRGKVVLLSFWATWCAPCMALVPHECALVKQREGKPFVLLGVNGDKDVAQAKKVAAAKGITWRSFKDQRDGEGAISKAWNLSGWPTLYLIDHKGIIRMRWVGAPPDAVLDREVDRLIAAAETEKLK